MGQISRACLAAVILLTGLTHPATSQDKKPDARVYIKQTQAALLFGASLGGGVLFYMGRPYEFSIGGLSVGGFGGSKVRARGEVYDMAYIDHFPGTYVAIRDGFALGEAGSGSLWLKNGHGVILRLQSEQKGIMLNLGADTLFVDWD